MNWKLCCSNLKKNFDLNRISEVYFWKSQWESFDPENVDTPISIYYLLYRALYLCWFLGTYLYYFTSPHGEDDRHFPIFLTNQTYTLQLSYSLLFFGYISWKSYSKRATGRVHVAQNSEQALASTERREKTHLHFTAKTILIIMNIVFVVPYAITAIYWVFLTGEQSTLKNHHRKARNHLFHSFNAAAALIESLMVAVPIRFTHCLFPMIWAFWYSVFSSAYELTKSPLPKNATSIYSIMNWRENPGKAVEWSVGGMMGTIIGHVIFCWGTYMLRLLLSKILKKGPRPIPSGIEEDHPLDPTITSTTLDKEDTTDSILATRDHIIAMDAKPSNVSNRKSGAPGS